MFIRGGFLWCMQANEEQLWSYLVQLATVLRSVHGAGLYFRPGGLHPSKIILTSKGRIRVSGVGILDVLHGDPADDPRMFQVSRPLNVQLQFINS